MQFGDLIVDTGKNNKCKQCGAAISEKSTGKLCPACLMSGVMKPPDANAETLSVTSGESILRYETSDLPCEFGRYRLLSLLGRGGMGTVYEAEEKATGRRIALKMLGQQLNSPDLRKRFLREGRLAASISHPNSLYVFGSEEINGLPVITMEIAGSGTLKDKLKKNGPMKITEAVDNILDVISGLESAYAIGVLHRDIKPSNCFISPDGSVKVGDFGLSVSTLEKADIFVTTGSKIVGTPAYASPEQLRGDFLDVRTDIYSVGATLYTLLTDRAPFEGDNAVQVVANAVNQKPIPLSDFRKDVPQELVKTVARCLSKESGSRYPDYTSLRNALLPFSSKEPEPASVLVRVSCGWIDFLIAFLIPYVAIMLFWGSEDLIIRPLVDRTLYSFRYYLAFLACGFLYFAICEGFFGAGLGKYMKGLHVVRTGNKNPGFWRALLRIVIIIVCVEGVRIPLTMSFISTPYWSGLQTAMFVFACIFCGWIPGLLSFKACKENGYATLWEMISGTRVQIKPKGSIRPAIKAQEFPEASTNGSNKLGPYNIVKELVTGKWIVAVDPVLRRHVWLFNRNSVELPLSRRNLSRQGRLRWLQKVENTDIVWDAFEAIKGVPFTILIKGGKRIPWSRLRYWLYDLASEIWEASSDNTLPAELSFANIWITEQGNAIMIDKPWPYSGTESEKYNVKALSGQQRFLSAIASCVDSISLPLHARGVLKNLEDGKFEKLSFLAGVFSGLLDKPVELSKGIRAGSIFVLPFYAWVAVFVGYYHDKQWQDHLGENVINSALIVLGAMALVQLFTVPFGNSIGQFIFKLGVINSGGKRASLLNLLGRWSIVWLPLFIPVLFEYFWFNRNGDSSSMLISSGLLAVWIVIAICTVIHPNRGLHDKLARTWVVRN